MGGFYGHVEVELYDELKAENKVLREIFEEIKEVEKSATLPNGDDIDTTTGDWLEGLIQTFEATNENK